MASPQSKEIELNRLDHDLDGLVYIHILRLYHIHELFVMTANNHHSSFTNEDLDSEYSPSLIRFLEAEGLDQHPFKPGIFTLVTSLCFIATSLLVIHGNINSSAGRKDLLEGDTGHYLAIAQDFARGDFSMTYVQARPHPPTST